MVGSAKVAPDTQVPEAPASNGVSKSTGVTSKVNPAPADVAIVEFAAVEYLAFEIEPEIAVTIARRGPTIARIELDWTKSDVNFGKYYVPESGHATLLPGEKSVTIKIKVQNNDDYNVESLADVELKFSDPMEKKALLGDLIRTRVVVLNEDTFPSNVTSKAILPVVKGFMLHNYKLFTDKTHWGLFYRLFPALNFLASQFIMQHMILNITNANAAHSKLEEGDEIPAEYDSMTFMLAALFLVNFLIGYKADVEFSKLKLGGLATKALRCAVMDTVTQLTPEGEDAFDVGRVMKIADVQVDLAIATVWMACFSMFANICKLGVIFAFIIFTAQDQARLNGSPVMNYMALIPFLMLGSNLMLFEKTVAKASSLNTDAMEADDAWSSFMVQASYMRQVITTFRKGFIVTEKFDNIHKACNAQNFKANTYAMQSRWVANLIPTAFGSVVMALAGYGVSRGMMTVGGFVVFVGAVNSFGPTTSAIFMDAFNMSKGYAGIVKLANLLNSETRRKQLHRGAARRKRKMAAYTKTLNDAANFDPEAPKLIVNDLTYIFKGQQNSTLAEPMNFEIRGGNLVMIKGGASIGKKNVLRLLARHFIPTTGFVHYPSRWRMRYMDATILFFGGDMNKLTNARFVGGEDGFLKSKAESMGTLEYNLKFGAQFKHPDHDQWDREIFDLCVLLGVSKELIGKDYNEFAVGPNAKKLTLIGLHGERLSLSDRALCTIARALLSSVDLLLMSNVFDVMGPTLAMHVLSILKTYARERAMRCLKTESDSTPQHLRKQKVIIFSTRLSELGPEADRIIHLGGDDDDVHDAKGADDDLSIASFSTRSNRTGSNRTVLPPVTKKDQMFM